MSTSHLHRILIPVDFSPAGECALEYGAKLASLFNAEIILLHILESAYKYPHGWFADESLLSDPALIKVKVTAKLNEYTDSIIKKFGITVQNIQGTGNPAKQIAEAVATHGIDLIVMGTHGASGAEELFMGRNAHKVVNLALCPVITIRRGIKKPEITSIVLPIDESLHSRQKANDIIPIATKCNAEIHILGLLCGIDKMDLPKLNIKLDSVEEVIKRVVCLM